MAERVPTYDSRVSGVVCALEKIGKTVFETGTIAALSAYIPEEVILQKAYSSLTKMPCIKRRDCYWEIAEKPGDVCADCSLRPHKWQQSVCARRKAAGLPTSLESTEEG